MNRYRMAYLGGVILAALAGCGEERALDVLGVPEDQHEAVPGLAEERAVVAKEVREPDAKERPPSRLPEFSEGGQWLVGREGGFEGEDIVPGADPDDRRLIHWRYDRDDEITLRGPVLGKRFVNLPGEHTGIAVELQTGGNFIDVLLGTTKFHYAHEIEVDIADSILVTGVLIDLPGRDMLLARKLGLGEHALILRDEDGWPLWYEREEWEDRMELDEEE